MPVQVGLVPPFRTRTVKEQGTHKIIMDSDGALSMWPIDGPPSIPHYLRFAITCRDDWNRLKSERLVCGAAGALPDRMGGA